MSYIKLETRRLYIDDEQWERTSSSWKSLEPLKNFNKFDETDESVSDYCQRITRVIEVPEPVAEQWLYCHYYNGSTVNNYGWIDYSNAVFECVDITLKQTLNLRVIDDYSNYVESRKQAMPFNDFMCIDQDKEYWIQERTWRVPPVIVDVKSFTSPPSYSDFSGLYQLVEGHSRLGYLLSMHHAGEWLKAHHTVYMLKKKINV